MKIALVTFPATTTRTVVAPPLPLAYLAAVLEQQRHVVRIYDLALREESLRSEVLTRLYTFRPHIIVLATDDSQPAQELGAALAAHGAAIIHLSAGLRQQTPWQAVAQVAASIAPDWAPSEQQNVIFGALMALNEPLDRLPFPARHLLHLEQYRMVGPAGDLFTTVLLGQPMEQGRVVMRNPVLAIAEMRNIAYEHGIWHFSFIGAPLNADLLWADRFLMALADLDPGVNWEATADYKTLDQDLLILAQRSGCRGLHLAFDAVAVLDSREERQRLTTAVRQARELGIHMAADIYLEARYSSIPALVDMSATFGLDDVRFCVQPDAVNQYPPVDESAMNELSNRLMSSYQESRGRQFFIDRFGQWLGPLIWRMGRTGLLGRSYQRQADGADIPGQAML